MAKLGDIVEGKTIGYNSTHKYIWTACLDCGRQKWIELRHGKPRNERCKSCSRKGKLNYAFGKRGKDSFWWKGGRRKDSKGYIILWADSTSPYFSMNNYGTIPEHRLVMAEYLRRCLESWEIVHHLNGIKDDNRIENLCLVTRKSHDTKSYIKFLQQRIRKLEAIAKYEKNE